MFSSFFKKNRNGILKRKDLIPKRDHIQITKEDSGHAVILADHGENFIEFHNSWGDKFGIEGSFMIED